MYVDLDLDLLGGYVALVVGFGLGVCFRDVFVVCGFCFMVFLWH